ncbi:MAG: hypothetical protein N2111_07990 [Candidatus Sumerlaeaceae bacterium]|nr:hypothetical protein [Candidatus Sumerlaeaceae bacterium]
MKIEFLSPGPEGDKDTPAQLRSTASLYHRILFKFITCPACPFSQSPGHRKRDLTPNLVSPPYHAHGRWWACHRPRARVTGRERVSPVGLAR